jgi:hypothetical protein
VRHRDWFLLGIGASVLGRFTIRVVLASWEVYRDRRLQAAVGDRIAQDNHVLIYGKPSP